MENSLIIVAGPTASGKTGLGIELAGQLGGEIVSADSRMVYQGLDIGTGKPTWEYRKLPRPPWIRPARAAPWGPIYTIADIDHHLLDVVAPETRFTLTDWLAGARAAITDIRSHGKQPIIVGGTGLYLKALVRGFEPPPTDPALRAELEEVPTDEIWHELQTVDPVTAARESKNRRRLIRALEVVRLTGRPMARARIGKPTEAIVLATNSDREAIYHRIDERTREQLAGGFVDEVRGLLDRGVSAEWLRSIGLEYRVVIDWLLAEPNRLTPFHLHSRSVGGEVLVLEKQLRTAIHAYARRQLTYLRHQLPVHWVESLADAEHLVTA